MVDIKHKNMIDRKDRYDAEIITILTHTHISKRVLNSTNNVMSLYRPPHEK